VAALNACHGHTGRHHDTSFANTLTLSSIEAGAAKIVIDPFLSDDPS
jgi:hypothetical protein